MRRTTIRLTRHAITALTVISLAGPAVADGDPGYGPATVDLSPANWTGGYVGVETGAGLGKSDVSDPYGASIFGDTVRTPEFLLGLAAGYNWQAPGSNWVYGIEGSVSYQDANGTNTCFAATGDLTSSNCIANPDWTGALTGRVGFAAGPQGRTLLFAKGGVAFQHSDVEAVTNNRFGLGPIRSTGTNTTSWGWTLGGGVEQMVAPAWSVKLEYDYLDFGSHDFSSPATFSTTPGGFTTPVAGRTTSVDQTNHLVKIGLNYRFGGDPYAGWPAQAIAPVAAPPSMFSDWTFETAGRYFYSVGRFQKDLGTSTAHSNISRLTYADLTANAGEWFARVDSPWGLFVKGFVGGGRINGGHMNDEDWGLGSAPPFTGYSNTYSSLTGTGMNYFTVDAGYDVLRDPGYKVGVFLGYNRIHEQYAATTCTQLASPSSGICAPPILNTPVITETDTWHSLRLGVETVAWLGSNLKLTAEAAYLPYVRFDGVDNHWLRSLVIAEDGDGQGAQLEAILSYYVTPAFSLGVGGRYWSMWMDDGKDAFNGVPTNRADVFRYERAGVFLEANYQFGSTD